MPHPEAINDPKNDLKQRGFGVSELFDLLLPPACRLCDAPVESGQYFCQSCWTGLSLSEPKMQSACQRCGRPGALTYQLSTNKADLSHSSGTKTRDTSPILDENSGEVSACAMCHKEKFAFQRVIARWSYEGRVCDAIIAAKYARQAPLGSVLGHYLGERVVQQLIDDDPPDVVTVVPSSIRRQFTRGGRNGNLAIAESVQKMLADAGVKSPLKQLLGTTRAIKKQAWLSDKERRQNVAGAFAAKKSYASRRTPGIAKQHILLVDDVVTTGATANEVARVLCEAGARRVTLAVVARAVWSK